eukprot:gb/GEZN01013190.1/.p1 GENE.gb/GEZN01013190.1/~~gb/GEZN01013190.1/.p1  ORF type:complete len:322 (-),score=80.85 gb/GEZN01013190.1/:43-1008(-)
MSKLSAMKQHAGVKRIMAEWRELQKDPPYELHAAPLDDNLFEWHFTIRGADETDFAGGLYHGRILLPTQYPFKPPDVILLTPSGRFQTAMKICLSISGYHPQNWQPAWGIRTVLIALIAFFPTKPQGGIGSLDYSSREKQALAAKSRDFKCEVCCKKNIELLPDVSAAEKEMWMKKPKEAIPAALLQVVPPPKDSPASPPAASSPSDSSPSSDSSSSSSSSSTSSLLDTKSAGPAAAAAPAETATTEGKAAAAATATSGLRARRLAAQQGRATVDGSGGAVRANRDPRDRDSGVLVVLAILICLILFKKMFFPSQPLLSDV